LNDLLSAINAEIYKKDPRERFGGGLIIWLKQVNLDKSISMKKVSIILYLNN
jgi:hypothetical protein